MKYLLRNHYALCGWDNLECCLLHKDSMNVELLSSKEFRLLLLCNGRTDFSDIPNLSPVPLEEFLKRGIVDEVQENVHAIRREPLYQKYHNRYIKCVHWSITGRCNYRCRHCYVDAPSGKANDLGIEEIKAIILQMRECGIFHVKITGGEPLIRKDFWEIVDEFIKNEIVIDEIYTNGFFLTDDFFQKIIERAIHPVFNLSFDGVGEHDWMRGVLGAERMADAAFERAREYGFTTRAEMCLHNGNRSAIRNTVNHLAELNVQQLKIGPVVNTELWRANCGSCRMTSDEYYETCMEYIPYYFQDGTPINISVGNVFQYDREKKSIRIPSEIGIEKEECGIRYLCKSARNTAYIDPRGRFLPCMVAASLPEPYLEMFPGTIHGNLRELLCASSYLDFIDMRVDELLSVNVKCGKCSDRYKCRGGCRIQAMMDHSGDRFGCDELMCDFYAKGINRKILEKIRKVTGANDVANI